MPNQKAGIARPSCVSPDRNPLYHLEASLARRIPSGIPTSTVMVMVRSARMTVGWILCARTMETGLEYL